MKKLLGSIYWLSYAWTIIIAASCSIIGLRYEHSSGHCYDYLYISRHLLAEMYGLEISIIVPVAFDLVAFDYNPNLTVLFLHK